MRNYYQLYKTEEDERDPKFLSPIDIKFQKEFDRIFERGIENDIKKMDYFSLHFNNRESSEDNFWRFVTIAEYYRDYDNNRCQKIFHKMFPDEQVRESLQKIFKSKVKEIFVPHETLKESFGMNHVGGDCLDDLRALIISFGKVQYDIFKNDPLQSPIPWLCRYKSINFKATSSIFFDSKESFAYSFHEMYKE